MKRFSLLAACNAFFAFLLITLGGFVHNTGSSLACPDWPLCFGQVFPKMEGGVAIEHSHRLLATLVGVIHIFLLWIGRRPGPHRKLLIASFFLLLLQGVWGGLTVLLKISPIMSTLHLGTSQIYLACLLLLSWKTNPSVQDCLNKAIQKTLEVAPPKKGLKVILALYFFQLIIGAIIRHGGASFACGIGWENSILCLDPMTELRSVWPQLLESKINWLHRALGMALILILVFKTSPWIRWGRKTKTKWIRLWCVGIHSTVTFQVFLGILTVATGVAVVPVTLHLSLATALGMLLMGLVFFEHQVYGKGNQ